MDYCLLFSDFFFPICCLTSADKSHSEALSLLLDSDRRQMLFSRTSLLVHKKIADHIDLYLIFEQRQIARFWGLDLSEPKYIVFQAEFKHQIIQKELRSNFCISIYCLLLMAVWFFIAHSFLGNLNGLPKEVNKLLGNPSCRATHRAFFPKSFLLSVKLPWHRPMPWLPATYQKGKCGVQAINMHNENEHNR